MLTLHLTCEFLAHIHDRHGELLLVVDRETERLQLTRIIRIRLEVEYSSTFPVVEEPFAVNLACVAGDREMNILTSGSRKVHALKRTRRPVRFVTRRTAVMVFDQRKLDFAGIVRLAQGPIAALNIRRSILHRNQKNAGCDGRSRPSKRGGSPAPGKNGRSEAGFLEIGLRIQNPQLSQLNQLLQSQILESMLLRTLNELRRNILHLGANDVADTELVSCGLQSLDEFRRDVLHAHGNEFAHGWLEPKSPYVANVFRSYILNPHGDGIVRSGINSLLMQPFQVFGRNVLYLQPNDLIRRNGQARSAEFANVCGSYALHLQPNQSVHVGLNTGFFEPVVILGVGALHFESDDLVYIRIEAGGAQPANVLGSDALHAHRNQVVYVEMQALLLELPDIFRRDVLNFQGDELINRKVAKSRSFHGVNVRRCRGRLRCGL